MDIKLIKTFVAVANHCSFTGAANELFIAQSAVSKHIALLEKELGTQLLLRDTRMVRLTPAGEAFYRDSADILDRLEVAVRRANGYEQTASGRLTVGAFSVLPGEAVETVRAFRQKYPGVKTVFEWYEFGDLIQKVKDGTVDVAFTIGFAANGKANFCRKTVRSGSVSVLVGRRSPLARKKSISLRELTDRRYYTMRPSTTQDGYLNIMQYFASKSFMPTQMITCSSHESMMLSLQADDEAFSLMGSFLYQEHPGLAFVPIAPEDRPEGDGFDLVAMWRANNENPCIPALLEVIPGS